MSLDRNKHSITCHIYVSGDCHLIGGSYIAVTVWAIGEESHSKAWFEKGKVRLGAVTRHIQVVGGQSDDQLWCSGVVDSAADVGWSSCVVGCLK